MNFSGGVYLTNGSADVVFATLGKKLKKHTNFSEIEGSRIRLLILTGGTDSDRSRVVCYCQSVHIKNDVRVFRRLN